MNIIIYLKIKYRECVYRERNDSDPQLTGTWWAGGVCIFYGLIFGLIFWNFVSHPKALQEKDVSNYPNRFISERAFKDLENLTFPGPRVTGGTNNDQYAANYIYNAVSYIIGSKNSSVNIEIDNEFESGAYTLSGLAFAFSGIQNIIAKYTTVENPNPEYYIALNAHFDTKFDSPGAADGGFGAVVLIEILRVISKFPIDLKHGIVFVWNGSQKLGFQGSYSFVANHEWAKNVRTFINVDAEGAILKEMMLQIDENHPWLMKVSIK